MKCLAIGDAFLPVKYFQEATAQSGLFEEVKFYSFRENLTRNEARNQAREMEINGSMYAPIPDEVIDKVKDVDVLFVHMFPVPASLIDAAKNLKYILTCRGGTENIDVAAAKERGIKVMNCTAHNANAVVELTIGLIICETRNIARSDRYLQRGEWREAFPNSSNIKELRSLTIGIVGFGAIGALLAEKLKVFGPKLIGYAPHRTAEEMASYGVEKVTMDELLAQSDVVTLHARLGKGDPPIIGKEELNKMKSDSYLINTARSALVDTEALAEALKEKRIMGAAVDVFPKEPVPVDFPLCGLDNITLTSHRGGDTSNSFFNSPELVMSQFTDFLRTGSSKFFVK